MAVDQLDQWSMLTHLHYKLADKLEGYNFKWKIEGGEAMMSHIPWPCNFIMLSNCSDVPIMS